MLSKFSVNFCKKPLNARQLKTIKNARLLHPLQPKTSEDECIELFHETIGVDKFWKEVTRLDERIRRNQQSGDKTKSSREKTEGESCQVTKYVQQNESRTMRALVLDVNAREITLNNVSIPKTLKKDEVSIKVKFAVANMTDLLVLEGKIPSDQKIIIPGRELSGVVFGAGEEVENIEVGDSVVVAPCQPNTLCPYCHQKGSETCIKEQSGNTFGINRNGGWAEFTTIPASMVYKTCGLSMEQAALLPALAQVICALDMMKIPENADVLVQGCGLAGMLLSLLLYERGHKSVCIVEDNPKQMEVIESSAIGYEVVAPVDLAFRQFDLIFSNGTGAGVMQTALEHLRSHGQFYIFGLQGKHGESPLIRVETNELSRKLLTIKGISGTPVNPSKVPVELAENILNRCKLGVPLIPLEDYDQALTKLTLREISSLIFKLEKS